MTRTLTWPLAAVGILVMLALAVADLLQGPGGLAASQVVEVLMHPDETLESSIVHDTRLPRAMAGVVAGMALAGAAVLLQALTRNPLAEPATLGMTAGGAFAVTLVTGYATLAPGAPTIAIAFVGVAAATALLWALAASGGGTGVRLILAGMAVGLALAAGTATVQIFRETEASALFLWGGGSILQLGWGPVRTGAILGGSALVVAALAARSLDVASLGQATARALGSRSGAVRLLALVLAAVLAAVAVGVAGPISFVGILAVGLARLARPRGHLGLLIVALPWGAAVVLGADVLGRLVLGTGMEVPAGLVCALIGAPVLVVVARRLRDEASPMDAGGGGGARWRPWMAVTMIALLPVVAVASLSLGAVNVSPGAIMASLAGGGDFLADLAIEERAPRLALALAAGACLAASGTVLQATVRNPFAGPELVGVTGGASLGALIVLLALPESPRHLLPFAAFAGGIGAMALVLALSWSRRSSPQRLALIGLAVTAACAALVALIILRASPAAAVAITWLAGSTYAGSWDDLWLVLAPAALLIPAAFAGVRRLDLLMLDDDLSRNLGLRVDPVRLVLLGVGAALAAAAVAAVGAIAFVGLLAPHAARLVAGGNHRRLLPVAMVMGALLLAIADVAGRSVLPPNEIPSGLVVSLIGAPYLAILMWRSRSAA